MNNETRATYKRLIRRETHSPRSVLAITLACSVILLCLLTGSEIILHLLNQRPLLVTPTGAADGIAGASEVSQPILIAGGIATGLVGLLLVLLALSPGRRSRHHLITERTAVVIDNEVIASALARRASYAGNVNPDDVRVRVSRRRARVEMTPSSGIPADRASAIEAVEREVGNYRLHPAIRPRVAVASKGKIGE